MITLAKIEIMIQKDKHGHLRCKFAVAGAEAGLENHAEYKVEQHQVALPSDKDKALTAAVGETTREIRRVFIEYVAGN